MDAKEYLKTRSRMTNCCQIDCDECPLSYDNNSGLELYGKRLTCEILEGEYFDRAVEIVEKWGYEHPIRTRQSELLKLFPDASIQKEIGVLYICPKVVDDKATCESPDFKDCFNCRKKYWLTEIKSN